MWDISFSSTSNWILNVKTQSDWEKVDHSVLLVGWVEENGEKYLLIQNNGERMDYLESEGDFRKVD